MEKAVISFLFIIILGSIVKWLAYCYTNVIIGEIIGTSFIVALATARITYVIEKLSKK